MLISSSINCSEDKSKPSFNTNISNIKAYVVSHFVRVAKEDSDSDSEVRSDNLAHFMPVGDLDFDKGKESEDEDSEEEGEGYADTWVFEGMTISVSNPPLLSNPSKKSLPPIKESLEDKELRSLMLEEEVKIEAGNSRSNSRLSNDLTPIKSGASPTTQKQCISPAFQRQLSSPAPKVFVLAKLNENRQRNLLTHQSSTRRQSGIDPQVASLLTGKNN